MRVTRLRYRHPMEPNFRRVVYQMLTQDNEATRVLVCYEWATEPHLLQVCILDLIKRYIYVVQNQLNDTPKFSSNRLPTVTTPNVYILEGERDLVRQQMEHAAVEQPRTSTTRMTRRSRADEPRLSYMNDEGGIVYTEAPKPTAITFELHRSSGHLNESTEEMAVDGEEI